MASRVEASSTAAAVKNAIIIGVGPGLGTSLVKRFAREGYNVGLIARSEKHIQTVANEIQKSNKVKAVPVTADVSNEQQLRHALQQIKGQLGEYISVLVFNASSFTRGSALEITPAALSHAISIEAIGLLTAVQEIVPQQLQHGRGGSVLVTGATASLRGGKFFAGLAVPKFAVRALTQSLAREFQPQGIHVAHVIVDGQIATPKHLQAQPDRAIDTFLNPDALADVYWYLHNQDKTVWTQELDTRPYVEKW